MHLILIMCLSSLNQLVAAEDRSSSSSPVSSWPGHLKPLGSEATRLPVSTRDDFPTPAEFYQHYVYPSVPVVFRQGARRSPAFEKWSDDYLKNLPEAQDVIDVEMKKIEDRRLPTMRMPFAEFLNRYKVHDEYLVTGVPKYLQKDVLIPPPLNCDNITANFLDTVMWFSSGGTKSVMHNDDVDNINCLFRGQKELLFVNYTKYRQQVVFDHPDGSYSSVEVEEVDLNKYPELRDVEFHEAKLEAGDCIYIPYKWIHQVNSIGSNIAVNIWWNHQAHIVPTRESCGPPKPLLSLADISFYVHDRESLQELQDSSPEREFAENPVEHMTMFMKEEGKTSLTKEEFVKVMSKKIPSLPWGSWNDEALDLGYQIFEALDFDEDNLITSQDLYELPNRGQEFMESNLAQKLIWLLDVVDERIAKQKQELLNRLVENEKFGKSDESSPEEDQSAERDEL